MHLMMKYYISNYTKSHKDTLQSADLFLTWAAYDSGMCFQSNQPTF